MALIQKADQNLIQLVNKIKSGNHQRLETATISVAFNDSKPFKGNRLNWGKVVKFSEFNKIFQGQRTDFCINICADVWQRILTPEQHEAYLDLNLSRCDAELVPETIEVNGKKQVVKDEYGRVSYTNEIKLDDEGKPKWRVLPMDLLVFSKNASRYGLWCVELDQFVKNLKK